MTDEGSHEFTRGLYGWITHTELSSTDPEATREWCAEVLRWKFQPPFPSPAGDYHLFAYSESGGGGIRQTAPGEAPGSTPTVHVEDTQAAYDAALSAGAESVHPPETVIGGGPHRHGAGTWRSSDRVLRADRLRSRRRRVRHVTHRHGGRREPLVMEILILCVVMFVGVVYGYYTVDGSGIAEHPYHDVYGGAPGAFAPASVYGRDEAISIANWSRGTR